MVLFTTSFDALEIPDRSLNMIDLSENIGVLNL